MAQPWNVDAKYQTLFESIDEGFCVVEVLFDDKEHPLDYRFVEVNPSCQRQTGLNDAVGHRMRELVPEHEDDWFQIYGEVVRSGRPIRFERRAQALQRWYDSRTRAAARTSSSPSWPTNCAMRSHRCVTGCTSRKRPGPTPRWPSACA